MVARYVSWGMEPISWERFFNFLFEIVNSYDHITYCFFLVILLVISPSIQDEYAYIVVIMCIFKIMTCPSVFTVFFNIYLFMTEKSIF